MSVYIWYYFMMYTISIVFEYIVVVPQILDAWKFFWAINFMGKLNQVLIGLKNGTIIFACS